MATIGLAFSSAGQSLSLSLLEEPLAEPAFTLTSSLANGRRLEVAGELDLASSPALRAALADLADGVGDVTVDLSAVTFIDSTALSILVHAHVESSAVGGRLIVTNPSPVVVRILHLAGLFTLLDIQGSVE
jgi:anti-sigma B factor antagonist